MIFSPLKSILIHKINILLNLLRFFGFISIWSFQHSESTHILFPKHFLFGTTVKGVHFNFEFHLVLKYIWDLFWSVRDMEICRDKTDFHRSLYSQIPRNKSHEKPHREAQGHKCKGREQPRERFCLVLCRKVQRNQSRQT